MKITPIEIRQHTFEKAMRGYRPDEVDAFLTSLSQEWERVVGDQKMLKMQLELAEKELNKLREVEMTLFRTLKTAEDTSSQITEQARVAGEQHLSEARQKADDILADARKRSSLMVQDSENQARYIKENIINDLKSTEHDLKALERYKDNLVTQIRTLATNANESVDRFEKKFARQSIQNKIDEVTAEVGNSQATTTESTAQPVDAAPADVPTDAGVSDTTATFSEAAPTESESSEPTADVTLETAEPIAVLDNHSDVASMHDSRESHDELPPLTDEDDELPTVATVSESIMAGVSHAAAQQMDTHTTASNGHDTEPTSASETDAKKEGGSFFDSI